MADAWQRWLRQQVELGGAEVILGGRESSVEGRGSRDEGRAPESPSESRSTHVQPAVDSPSAAQPKWMVGAPPIPGPGLSVDPPAWGLGDELPGLASLDTVAARIASIGDMPSLTIQVSSRALVPCANTPTSLPLPMVTPTLRASAKARAACCMAGVGAPPRTCFWKYSPVASGAVRVGM